MIVENHSLINLIRSGEVLIRLAAEKPCSSVMLLVSFWFLLTRLFRWYGLGTPSSFTTTLGGTIQSISFNWNWERKMWQNRNTKFIYHCIRWWAFIHTLTIAQWVSCHRISHTKYTHAQQRNWQAEADMSHTVTRHWTGAHALYLLHQELYSIASVPKAMSLSHVSRYLL